jgi:hypothetical protein
VEVEVSAPISPLTGITYRAVVKYPVKATDKEKLAALREGLQEIVTEMVDEHPSVDRDYIDRAIEDALGAAEDALEYREQYNAEHPEKAKP